MAPAALYDRASGSALPAAGCLRALSFGSDVSSQEACHMLWPQHITTDKPFHAGTEYAAASSAACCCSWLQQLIACAAPTDICAPLQAQASRWLPTHTQLCLMSRTATLTHRQVGHFHRPCLLVRTCMRDACTPPMPPHMYLVYILTPMLLQLLGSCFTGQPGMMV